MGMLIRRHFNGAKKAEKPVKPVVEGEKSAEEVKKPSAKKTAK